MASPPKPLSHAPKNPTRRSREERERLDKLESQRLQARADASAADAAAEAARRRAYYGIQRDHAEYKKGADITHSLNAGLGGSLRYVGGGRGGFMGQRGPTHRTQPAVRNKKTTATGATGNRDPAVVIEDDAAPTSSTRRRTTRRAGIAESSLATTDGGQGIKADPDGATAILGNQMQATLKDEDDYGHVSTDDERMLGKNIEYINLVSDEEDEEDLPDAAVDGESSRRRAAEFQPLRIPRKPHKDRNMSFNTDLSSSSAARVRKDGRERTRTDTDATSYEAQSSTSRKGKARGSDAEMTVRDRRRWTGAYEDDNIKSTGVNVKDEGGDGDGAVAGEPSLVDNEGDDAPQQAGDPRAEGSSTRTKEAMAAKARNRKKASQATSKRPVFQTIEDRREYEKQQQDREDVQFELGEIRSAVNRNGASGTATSSAAEATQMMRDKKEDAVYLFQLPPIIPDLLEPSVKHEPQSPQTTARSAPAASAPTINPTTSGPIKIEDDLDNSNLQNTAHRAPQFAAGKVGKLRVHQSGRATLTWGGTSMEVNQGTNPYFLQSVVLASMNDPAADQGIDSMDVDGGRKVGEATSFGQVRGKLVITPDWNEILG